MNKTEFSEAMYALPNNIISKRRKPLILPSIIVLGGVACIFAGDALEGKILNELYLFLLFVGSLCLVFGGIALARRVAGQDHIPYHRASNQPLIYEELFFSPSHREEIIQLIKAGELQKLMELPVEKIPSLVVTLYHTKGFEFAAAQAYTFSELEYKKITDLQVVNR